MHCSTIKELDQLALISEHTKEQSLNISKVLESPRLFSLEDNYVDEDECADFINIQGK